MTFLQNDLLGCMLQAGPLHGAQGIHGGRDGFLGGRSQQQPKKKKEKCKLEDTPAKPWRPVSEQEVLDGARYHCIRGRLTAITEDTNLSLFGWAS